MKEYIEQLKILKENKDIILKEIEEGASNKKIQKEYKVGRYAWDKFYKTIKDNLIVICRQRRNNYPKKRKSPIWYERKTGWHFIRKNGVIKDKYKLDVFKPQIKQLFKKKMTIYAIAQKIGWSISGMYKYITRYITIHCTQKEREELRELMKYLHHMKNVSYETQPKQVENKEGLLKRVSLHD